MAKVYTGSQEVVIPVSFSTVTIPVIDEQPVVRLRILISRNTEHVLISRVLDSLLLSARGS